MTITMKAPVSARPSGIGRLAQSLKGVILHRRWLAFLIVLAVWQLIAMGTKSSLLPTPWRVAGSMWEILISGLFFRHMSDSLQRIGIGFVSAMFIGTAIGVAMGARRFWDKFFQDVVVLMLSLPGLIYALLSVMIFGLGTTAPVVAILCAAYPFITVNIREGVKVINKELLDMSRAFRVERWKVLRQVVLPSLLPFFLVATRVGFTIAWKVSVLTEVYGASSGVGYMIRVNFQMFRLRDIIAWGLLFGGVMMLIEYGILLPAERYFARWRPKIDKVI